MEFLKDVFTPFYERIKRPFIGAFWISVILTNWEVWVALFFYGEKVGSENKITYINDLLKTETLICTPLLYTVIFLIIGQMLDVAAFWWQLIIRKLKNSIKNKFNPGTMVDGKTLIRVSEQLADAKIQIQTKSEEISKLGEDIKIEKQTSFDRKKLSFEPSINYFLGQWKLSTPYLSNIIISISNKKLSEIEGVININLNNNQIHSVKFLPIQMSKNGIILPILNKEDENIFGEIINSHSNNVNIDFFLKLLKNETIYWNINHGFESIRKNEFSIQPNARGAQVTLTRIDSYSENNKLWPTDENNEFALPD